MKKKLSVLALSAVLSIGVGSASAFENITAQEAYNMVSSNEATIIDVRTLEEVVWVGSPALEPGGNPIAYLIPWKLWTGVDATGKSIEVLNGDFNKLVEQTFTNKDQTLITMCRSGQRSTDAAKRLEDELHFTNVYEMDNLLKEKESESSKGGCGGFQGSNYGNVYEGNRGYPERLPVNSSPKKITVETVTEEINNADDSVSWLDTGLPITQKVDPNLIPTL